MSTNKVAESNPESLPHDEEERDDAIIGYALWWSLGVIALVGIVVGGAIFWATRPPVMEHSDPIEVAPPRVREATEVELPKIEFTDVTAEAGIDFVHNNGATGEKLLPETMGGGCAFFDYDNDGDQDLLLVNSADWPWTEESQRKNSTSALYQNDGTGKFTDVTQDAGLDIACYGMGVAIGDYDNNGWQDVYITAVGPNRLLRNNQGKFEDVTESSGAAGEDDQWGTSCGWFDCDNDGDLDLFVCNYVQWSREIDLAQDFRLTGIGRAYGPPFSFAGTHPYLFRNDGDGKFTEISEQAGLRVLNPDTGVPMAKSLGLAIVDLDDDGLLDVVVANDTVQNFVFHNKGEGKFAEIGAATGIAFDAAGKARGAMGIDAARFRNDQTLGVAIGNFAHEMSAFYVSAGDRMLFSDAAISTGLGPPTRLDLTFGLFFFDADLDGRVDLFSANGHLETDINKVQASQSYRQPPKLFYNCGSEGSSEFCEMPPELMGDGFSQPIVGRGATFADIDSDGDLDVLVTAVGEAPRLLRNDQQSGHRWLRVRLIGNSPRDAIGAVVEVRRGDELQTASIAPTRSYLSQSESLVTFGLGENSNVDEVVIRWPDGQMQTVANPPIDQVLTVTQDDN